MILIKRQHNREHPYGSMNWMATFAVTALVLGLSASAFALPTAKIGPNQWSAQPYTHSSTSGQLPGGSETGALLTPGSTSNTNALVFDQKPTENLGVPQSTPSAVPEPATAILAGLGLAAAAWRMRRARGA